MLNLIHSRLRDSETTHLMKCKRVLRQYAKPRVNAQEICNYLAGFLKYAVYKLLMYSTTCADPNRKRENIHTFMLLYANNSNVEVKNVQKSV